jgi:hypothetical protein
VRESSGIQMVLRSEKHIVQNQSATGGLPQSLHSFVSFLHSLFGLLFSDFIYPFLLFFNYFFLASFIPSLIFLHYFFVFSVYVGYYFLIYVFIFQSLFFHIHLPYVVKRYGKRQSCPCNRTWKTIGLGDVEVPTFSRYSSHRWR